MIRYRLTLALDDNGTILLTSPDLPVVTYGETEEQAYRNAEDAIATLLESMMSAREAVPVPTFVDEVGVQYLRLSLQTDLKISLHNAMLASGLTRADLMRRLGWQRESVDRLFKLNHNSKLDQIESAFNALGKSVKFDVREAA